VSLQEAPAPRRSMRRNADACSGDEDALTRMPPHGIADDIVHVWSASWRRTHSAMEVSGKGLF
jgi:hypothetical protein